MSEFKLILRTTEQGIILHERMFTVKTWHWGIVVVFIVAYLVGVKFPATGQTVLSKVGLA